MQIGIIFSKKVFYLTNRQFNNLVTPKLPFTLPHHIYKMCRFFSWSKNRSIYPANYLSTVDTITYSLYYYHQYITFFIKNDKLQYSSQIATRKKNYRLKFLLETSLTNIWLIGWFILRKSIPICRREKKIHIGFAVADIWSIGWVMVYIGNIYIYISF